MTSQEILTKAIEKAIAGGWKGVECIGYDDRKFYSPESVDLLEWRYSDDFMRFDSGGMEHTVETVNVYAVIFDKEFAKALWGDGTGYTGGTGSPEFKPIPRWQSRLQDMVIADDPIKYLGEHMV